MSVSVPHWLSNRFAAALPDARYGRTAGVVASEEFKVTNTRSTVQSERRYARWCHSCECAGRPHFAVSDWPASVVYSPSWRWGGCRSPARRKRTRRSGATDAVNQRIERNIEQYRKGDATLEVVDAAGKPVPGVRVEVQQTGHEFLFGCNAFVLGQLPTAEENRRYEEAFVRLFNFATVPFYWEGTEPTQGELRYEEGSRDMWRRPPADRYLPWAAKHGITLKGHPLLWHAYNPPWLPKDADELRELYRKRFREIAGRYGDKISIFDVVNESLVCSKTYPLYSADRAYVAWAFTEAAPLFPDSTHADDQRGDELQLQAGRDEPVLRPGQVAAGAGREDQRHRPAVPLLPPRGARRLSGRRQLRSRQDAGPLREAFGEFELPLYITEITIPSAGPDGEALQAEVVRDHYRLWFSAPSDGGHHVVEPGRRHGGQGRERGPGRTAGRRTEAQGRLPRAGPADQPGVENRKRQSRPTRTARPVSAASLASTR